MQRKALLGAVTVFAGALVAAYCGMAVAQPGDPRQVTPVGVWDLKGEDDAKTSWIATLVLRRVENDPLAGHIDWLASNGSHGREHFTATYEPKSRALKLLGTRVEFSQDIVRGTYQAELSKDGSALENGRWSDLDPTIPGTWSAKRIDLK